jgi:hypothetical protein
MVRCPHHGRIYDNTKEEGCPVCLSLPPGWEKKAAAAAAKPEKTPTNPFLYLVLGVVLLAGAGFGGWTWYQARQAKQRAAEERARREMLQPTIPDTTVFARADDLTPIRRARALASVIDGLVSANRSALLGFPEGPVDTAAADRAEQRRAKSYVQLATRWHARLDNASSDGTDFRYEPGVQFSLQMERATNALSAALAVARDVVPMDRVRPRADRQRDLTAIVGYIRSARTELSNLPR